MKYVEVINASCVANSAETDYSRSSLSLMLVLEDRLSEKSHIKLYVHTVYMYMYIYMYSSCYINC